MARLTAIWRTTTFRLTAALVAVFALAAIVLVGGIYWQTNALLTRQLAQEVIRESARLASIARNTSAMDLVARIDTLAKRDPKRLYLLLPAGLPQARAGNLTAWPKGVETNETVTVFRHPTDNASQNENRHLIIGIGRQLGDGSRLLVARDADLLATLADRAVWWFAAAAGLLALFGLVVGIIIARLVLSRVARITATGERIMTGRLSERIALEGSDDEFDALARNLNRMLTRIEELMASFREVSDNIAHDLKTPLNRLRNSAEEALTNPGGERAGLERVVVEADDLIRTFNALLQVARLEAGATDEAREPLDISGFARGVVEFYEPVAEEVGARIAFHGADGIIIDANRQLLGQALTNLIENALKYAVTPRTCRVSNNSRRGDDADITVRVLRQSGYIKLSVADRGAGIAESDRTTALKRFGRLDGSRSQPGTGLGLSLAGAVARLHGGRIELDDNNPGLVATLIVPDDSGALDQT